MAVPSIAVSGVQAYGVIIGSSGVVTINSVSYRVNSWKPDRAVQIAEQTTPIGTPSTWRSTVGFDTAEGELQLVSNATTYPKHGDTMQVTSDSNYGVETWAVMPVSVPQSNSPTETRTLPCKFRKVTDTGNYSTVA